MTFYMEVILTHLLPHCDCTTSTTPQRWWQCCISLICGFKLKGSLAKSRHICHRTAVFQCKSLKKMRKLEAKVKGISLCPCNAVVMHPAVVVWRTRLQLIEKRFAFSYREFVIYYPFSQIPRDGRRVSCCRLESPAPRVSMKPRKAELLKFCFQADFYCV